MKKRPKSLWFLTCFLVAVALSLPLQIMLLYGDTPFDLGAISAKLTPLNWAVIAASLLCAALMQRASPWLKLLTPVFILVVIWNNWLVGAMAINFSGWTALGATLLVLLAHGALWDHEVRLLIRKPQMRWWLTPARTRVSLNTRICPVLGGELTSRTFDISETGAFIAFDSAVFNERKLEKALAVGAYCAIRMNLNEFHSLSCSARIVRRTQGQGQYPAGFAVQFVSLQPHERRQLCKYLRSVGVIATSAPAAAA